MRSHLIPRAALLGALGLASCVSPKFEKAWKNAAQDPEPHTSRWEGRWQSNRHGAGGKLRAVVGEPKDGRLSVFFEAGWHGFTTAYPVELRAEPVGAFGKNTARIYRLSGEHDLKSCVGGGIYTYSGTLESARFLADYTSKYDAGTFRLIPVASKP